MNEIPIHPKVSFFALNNKKAGSEENLLGRLCADSISVFIVYREILVISRKTIIIAAGIVITVVPHASILERGRHRGRRKHRGTIPPQPILTYHLFEHLRLTGQLLTCRGAFLCGLLIGVIEALVAGYIDTNMGSLGIFILLLVVLHFRPAGLFGRGERVA